MNDLYDLFLKYIFTDRGGSRVYEIYPAEDHMELKHKIGEIRLKESEFKGEGVHGDGTG